MNCHSSRSSPVGLICLATGIIVLLPLSKIFLSRKEKKKEKVTTGKSLNQLVSEYSLADNLFRVRATDRSSITGKTVLELDLRRKYGINIMEIRRGETSQHRFLKTVTQELASPDTVISSGDVLYMNGSDENVSRFASDYRMEMLDEHTSEVASGAGKTLAFYDIGIAEIVLMPSSDLINRSIKEAGFRDKFNVNVLGIRRKNDYILHELGDAKMHSGDVLLVQGSWQDIARLSREDSEVGSARAASRGSGQSHPRLQGARRCGNHDTDGV